MEANKRSLTLVAIAGVVFASHVCSQSAIVRNSIGSPPLPRLPRNGRGGRAGARGGIEVVAPAALSDRKIATAALPGPVGPKAAGGLADHSVSGRLYHSHPPAGSDLRR